MTYLNDILDSKVEKDESEQNNPTEQTTKTEKIESEGLTGQSVLEEQSEQIKPKKKRHILRNIIIVLFILGIIGAVGGNPNNQRGENEKIKEMDNVEISKEYFTPIKLGVDTWLKEKSNFELDGNLLDSEFSCTAYRDQDEPVIDNNGIQYPYTFIVRDKRRLKDSSVKFTYMAMIGFRSTSEIENFNPTFLEYADDLTGQHTMIIPEQDSFILESNKALNEIFSNAQQ